MTSPWTRPMSPSVAWTSLTAAHGHLAQGEGVVGDELRDVAHARPRP